MISKIFKFVKKNILGVIIGGFIFGIAGVSATTYLYRSNQISYSNSNSTVTNVKEAIDDLYKIKGYTVQENTYFYDELTKGTNNIVRYKKDNNNYYLCNQYGEVSDSIIQDVTGKNLIAYTSAISSNLSAGSAGYAGGKFVLGDGTDNNTYGKNKKIERLVYQNSPTWSDWKYTFSENYDNVCVFLIYSVHKEVSISLNGKTLSPTETYGSVDAFNTHKLYCMNDIKNGDVLYRSQWGTGLIIILVS